MCIFRPTLQSCLTYDDVDLFYGLNRELGCMFTKLGTPGLPWTPYSEASS